MSYQLKEVKIRTSNTSEGMQKIGELWQDIMEGKLPLIQDREHLFVSEYSNYESDENGEYDLAILSVKEAFLQQLEKKAADGTYCKYEFSDEEGNVQACTVKAWQQVWEDKKNGAIQRTFTKDFEYSVPAEYAKDGIAHCMLYIAVK